MYIPPPAGYIIHVLSLTVCMGYMYLSHALKNTANQRPGLPLHILQYAMGNNYATGSCIQLYVPVITCVQQFNGVHLRTSQKPALKLFNFCEPLQTFLITPGNHFWRFLNTFEEFRRFSENFKKAKKHLENTFELFPKFFKSFTLKSFKLLKNESEAFPKFLEIHRDFLALPKISVSFTKI